MVCPNRDNEHRVAESLVISIRPKTGIVRAHLRSLIGVGIEVVAKMNEEVGLRV